MSLRTLLTAIAVSLLLAIALGRFEYTRAEPPGTTAVPATPASPASTAQKPAAKPPADGAGTAADEAAAKHAKRTACLKSAKAKKLVGTQKKAFVNECTAAP